MDKILIKRGTKEKLEKSSPLSQGELFLAKDEERLYVGGPKGNIPILTQKDVDEKYQEVATQLSQIEQRLELERAKIIVSDKEPSGVDDETFWYEDKGEAPIDFMPGGGISITNAVVSDTEPRDTDALWFDVKNKD